jgi:DNA-binding MltR family transcriptional regulator
MAQSEEEDGVAFLSRIMDQTAKLLASRSPDEGKLVLEVIAFRKTLFTEGDRATALMASSFMEERLKDLISAFFVESCSNRQKLFQHNGPFGSFSSRIDSAYSLGLIPENVCKELHLVRRIRNEFAHTATSLDFSSEGVQARCNSLTLHGESADNSPRSKFTRSMMVLLSLLTVEILRTERRPTREDHDISPQIEGLKQFRNFLTEVGREELLQYLPAD